MASAGNMNVDPEGTRDHAKKTEALNDELTLALQAAAYLAHVDDGYGLLVRPYAQSKLNSVHDDITEGLRTTIAELGDIPRTLRFAADTFEGTDETQAGKMDKQRARIERVGDR